MQLRSALCFTGLVLLSGMAAPPAHAARPDLDVTAAARPSPAVQTLFEAARNQPSFRGLGIAAHVDERYGVPSFVWAVRTPASSPSAARALAAVPPERAARDHLTRFSSYYGLDAEVVRARHAALAPRHWQWQEDHIFSRSFDGIGVSTR
jgi:hypothetical protein